MTLLLLGAFLVWCFNYIDVSRLILNLGNEFVYTTANKDFLEQEDIYKGGPRDLQRIERRFDYFLEQNPQTKDTILYRTFDRNPLKFWYWREYLTNRRYDYPCLNSGSIPD